MVTDDLLVEDEVSRNRIIFGYDSWAVTLGMFDVHFSGSNMWSYNYEPSKVHIGIIFRLFGYLKHHMKF